MKKLIIGVCLLVLISSCGGHLLIKNFHKNLATCVEAFINRTKTNKQL